MGRRCYANCLAHSRLPTYLEEDLMSKPKLLIIGHARHGKDTVAEKIRDKVGLAFTSSSLFVGWEHVWWQWGWKHYTTFDDMFADRANHRKTLADLISAYNTPDKTRTAKTTLNRGYDMYVGMRRRDEFNAGREAGLFDHLIWVDASRRLPPESTDSMELVASDADIYFDNNGAQEELNLSVLQTISKIAFGLALLFLALFLFTET
jgi:hypothetical protein